MQHCKAIVLQKKEKKASHRPYVLLAICIFDKKLLQNIQRTDTNHKENYKHYIILISRKFEVHFTVEDIQMTHQLLETKTGNHYRYKNG